LFFCFSALALALAARFSSLRFALATGSSSCSTFSPAARLFYLSSYFLALAAFLAIFFASLAAFLAAFASAGLVAADVAYC